MNLNQMLFRRSILIIFFYLLLAPLNANTLFLSYLQKDDQIECIGVCKDQVERLVYPIDKLLEHTHTLYDAVENKTHKKMPDFLKSQAYLSEHLIHPFEGMLENCSSIQITLDSTLLKIPFEYLRLNKKELSTYRAMVFRLPDTNFAVQHESINLESGTIVRDKSCDPQNACKTIKETNAKFKFFSSKEIKPNDLALQNQDFLLISAHGYAYENNRGVLGWDYIHMQRETLIKLNPKLAYFDSCQQGINLNYLEAFKAAEGLNYYIAPIISNDAGDSSTKTIEWFFEFLQNGLTPSKALFETKKKLKHHYKRKKLLTIYNKALSFRLYEL